MKKLILFLMVLFTITSCTVEYTAVIDDAPVVIRDKDNIIQDAIRMNLDTIYVLKASSRDFYTPQRWMGEEKITFWTDTLRDQRVISGSLTYRKVALSSLYER